MKVIVFPIGIFRGFFSFSKNKEGVATPDIGYADYDVHKKENKMSNY